MNRFKPTLPQLFLIVALSSCSSPLPAPTAPPAPVSALRFDTPTLDLGAIFVGEKKRLEYTFANTGERDVTIVRLRPGCGCTEAAAQPTVVPPGGMGRVGALFDSSGFEGPVEKHIEVVTDEPGVAPFDLAFTAEIEPRFLLQPQIVHLPHLKANEPASATVAFQDLTGGQVSIASIKSANPQITAKLTDIEADRATILIEFPPSPSGSRLETTVYVVTTDKYLPQVEIFALAFID